MFTDRPDDGVEPLRFRQTMAHAPTAVAIVTGIGAHGPTGLAVGSFVSVSLDPLLVGFFCANSSSSWPTVRATGNFCVNLLADDQTDMCRRFAARGGDKFADVAWSPGRTGAPVLDGCLAFVECELADEIQTGDHTLVLGRVRDLDVARDTHALVFHRGSYTSTASEPLTAGAA